MHLNLLRLSHNNHCTIFDFCHGFRHYQWSDKSDGGAGLNGHIGFEGNGCGGTTLAVGAGREGDVCKDHRVFGAFRTSGVRQGGEGLNVSIGGSRAVSGVGPHIIKGIRAQTGHRTRIYTRTAAVGCFTVRSRGIA